MAGGGTSSRSGRPTVFLKEGGGGDRGTSHNRQIVNALEQSQKATSQGTKEKHSGRLRKRKVGK